MKSTGKVIIHNREYETVAFRVKKFREEYKLWTIETEIISRNENEVVMKAIIKDEQGRIIATGHSEENRNSSQINRTSAIENGETSAIGRALAAFGMGGTEFASANEVENAIHQQSEKVNDQGQPPMWDKFTAAQQQIYNKRNGTSWPIKETKEEK